MLYKCYPDAPYGRDEPFDAGARLCDEFAQCFQVFLAQGSEDAFLPSGRELGQQVAGKLHLPLLVQQIED